MTDVAREYPVLGVHELHDGDTYRLMIDVGFEEASFPWLRLKGWNAPELSQPGGTDALNAAENLLRDAAGGPGLWVRTFKRPGYEDMKKSFARYIADIYVGDFAVRDQSDQPGIGLLLSAGGHVVRV